MLKLVEKLYFQFSEFFGRVSFSYSTKSKPFDKLTAVSTLSANLFPKESLKLFYLPILKYYV